MIFKPEMVEKILGGEKTVTRRPVKFDAVTSAWLPCRYEVGKDYAVQPGRGKKAVGRIRVLSVVRRRIELFTLSSRVREAQREGFKDWWAFKRYWTALYGSWDAAQLVDRIEFELLGSAEDAMETAWLWRAQAVVGAIVQSAGAR